MENQRPRASSYPWPAFCKKIIDSQPHLYVLGFPKGSRAVIVELRVCNRDTLFAILLFKKKIRSPLI
jgi:hypothetical protein